jgi:hypothetical protein
MKGSIEVRVFSFRNSHIVAAVTDTALWLVHWNFGINISDWRNVNIKQFYIEVYFVC